MKLWEYSGNENLDDAARYSAIVLSESIPLIMATNSDNSDQWEAIGCTSGHAAYCVLSGKIIAAFAASIDGDFYPVDVAEEMSRRLSQILKTADAPIPHPFELFRQSASAGDDGNGATYRATGESIDTDNDGVDLILPVTDFPA